MSRAPRAIVPGLLSLLLAGSARAEVLFQNTGNKQGWESVFTQKAGTVTEVSTPVYKGTTAIKATQTYQTSDGANYHSETIKRKAQLAGQDLYYGQAVYLPPDWVFHSQNVTFQQWAPEDPEAPWILMYVQNDKIRLGGRGQMGDADVGPITGLRGTWMRIITRIHMANPGVFEVWINDRKFYSRTGNVRAMGPSLRWSSGIYCTRWDTETPTGPRELSIFHDNLRIATTYEEADPAKWGDGDPTPPPPADAGPAADASPAPGPIDAGAPIAVDAAPAPRREDAASGGRGGMGGAGGTGGEEPETVPPKRTPGQSGCALVPGAGRSSWWVAVAAIGALLLRRRRRF